MSVAIIDEFYTFDLMEIHVMILKIFRFYCILFVTKVKLF